MLGNLWHVQNVATIGCVAPAAKPRSARRSPLGLANLPAYQPHCNLCNALPIAGARLKKEKRSRNWGQLIYDQQSTVVRSMDRSIGPIDLTLNEASQPKKVMGQKNKNKEDRKMLLDKDATCQATF